MGIKTLKGLRKQQSRQLLIDNGLEAVRHRYNRLDTDFLFQITLNRLAEATQKPVYREFLNTVTKAQLLRARSCNEIKDGRFIYMNEGCLTCLKPIYACICTTDTISDK